MHALPAKRLSRRLRPTLALPRLAHLLTPLQKRTRPRWGSASPLSRRLLDERPSRQAAQPEASPHRALPRLAQLLTPLQKRTRPRWGEASPLSRRLLDERPSRQAAQPEAPPHRALPRLAQLLTRFRVSVNGSA